MDETMNTEMEVTTNEFEIGETTQEIEVQDNLSGPSKGFLALIGGSIVAVAVGATIAINRHKKKKEATHREKDLDNEERVDPTEAIEVEATEVDENCVKITRKK